MLSTVQRSVENMVKSADQSAALESLLANFQLNFGSLSELCVDKLKHQSASLWKRYILDFFICHLIIAPTLVAFWRGKLECLCFKFL